MGTHNKSRAIDESVDTAAPIDGNLPSLWAAFLIFLENDSTAAKQ
jgi:hypothetical protein